jgi:hypothetical protein
MDETTTEERRTIGKREWDAMDAVYRLRRHYRYVKGIDKQIEELIDDEVGFGGMTCEAVIDELALGVAMLAEGYRLHETQRHTVWTFHVPDKALAWRTIPRGYIAMSEARAMQYIFKMPF